MVYLERGGSRPWQTPPSLVLDPLLHKATGEAEPGRDGARNVYDGELHVRVLRISWPGLEAGLGKIPFQNRLPRDGFRRHILPCLPVVVLEEIVRSEFEGHDRVDIRRYRFLVALDIHDAQRQCESAIGPPP